jgi:hypothetical protein
MEFNNLFAKSADARIVHQSVDVHVKCIFATDEQQTWLIADPFLVHCVLDDRRWQEPRLQWRRRPTDCLPVQAGEYETDDVGTLQFGIMTKKWLYSRFLFADQPVAETITGLFSLAAR